jgi:hypothetical protein
MVQRPLNRPQNDLPRPYLERHRPATRVLGQYVDCALWALGPFTPWMVPTRTALQGIKVRTPSGQLTRADRTLDP